jgi:hypothetical protein
VRAKLEIKRFSAALIILCLLLGVRSTQKTALGAATKKGIPTQKNTPITKVKGLVPTTVPRRTEAKLHGRTVLAPSSLVANKGFIHTFALSSEEPGDVQFVAMNGFYNSPVWSPDGQWVAYLSGFRENVELMVARRDGTDSRVIESGAGPARWSSDGSRLIRLDKDPETNRNILRVIEIATGTAKSVQIPDAVQRTYDWALSPADDSIAITGEPKDSSGTVNSLYIVDANGPRSILQFDKEKVIKFEYGNLLWSPTGEFVRFGFEDRTIFGNWGLFGMVDTFGRKFESNEYVQRFPAFSPAQFQKLDVYWSQTCSLWASGGCIGDNPPLPKKSLSVLLQLAK